ncbi:MAG TPA: hypothetical protein VJW23_10000 [Propionibacteriaceae bacterium]|nr:hypothetical protein [Propionibacteriaceae bacterium]
MIPPQVVVAKLEFELEAARLALKANHYVQSRDALERMQTLIVQLRGLL